MPTPDPIITVRENCRKCYACVRNCPVKAIRVRQDHAEIIDERCIGCGKCVQVCSQKAKVMTDGIGQCRRLLDGPVKPVAVLGCSYPAFFQDIRSGQLVNSLKHLGFAEVHEGTSGVDLLHESLPALHRRQRPPTAHHQPLPDGGRPDRASLPAAAEKPCRRGLADGGDRPLHQAAFRHADSGRLLQRLPGRQVRNEPPTKPATPSTACSPTGNSRRCCTPPASIRAAWPRPPSTAAAPKPGGCCHPGRPVPGLRHSRQPPRSRVPGHRWRAERPGSHPRPGGRATSPRAWSTSASATGPASADRGATTA